MAMRQGKEFFDRIKKEEKVRGAQAPEAVREKERKEDQAMSDIAEKHPIVPLGVRRR